MKTILDPSTRRELEARIARLAPASHRQWGKMNAGQMLCHVTDSFREGVGVRVTKPSVPAPLRPIIKRFMFIEKPWKPGSPTSKYYDQVKGGGTPPSDFEQDRRTLLEMIDRFVKHQTTEPIMHPAAGKLSKEEFGQLMWKHLDHHLRQFGV